MVRRVQPARARAGASTSPLPRPVRRRPPRSWREPRLVVLGLNPGESATTPLRARTAPGRAASGRGGIQPTAPAGARRRTATAGSRCHGKDEPATGQNVERSPGAGCVTTAPSARRRPQPRALPLALRRSDWRPCATCRRRAAASCGTRSRRSTYPRSSRSVSRGSPCARPWPPELRALRRRSALAGRRPDVLGAGHVPSCPRARSSSSALSPVSQARRAADKLEIMRGLVSDLPTGSTVWAACTTRDPGSRGRSQSALSRHGVRKQVYRLFAALAQRRSFTASRDARRRSTSLSPAARPARRGLRPPDYVDLAVVPGPRSQAHAQQGWTHRQAEPDHRLPPDRPRTTLAGPGCRRARSRDPGRTAIDKSERRSTHGGQAAPATRRAHESDLCPVHGPSGSWGRATTTDHRPARPRRRRAARAGLRRRARRPVRVRPPARSRRARRDDRWRARWLRPGGVERRHLDGRRDRRGGGDRRRPDRLRPRWTPSPTGSSAGTRTAPRTSASRPPRSSGRRGVDWPRGGSPAAVMRDEAARYAAATRGRPATVR